MNGWELFTWANVVILGIGSPIVLVFFLLSLKGMLAELAGHKDEPESPLTETPAPASAVSDLPD